MVVINYNLILIIFVFLNETIYFPLNEHDKFIRDRINLI